MKQTTLIIALCALFATFSTAHTKAGSEIDANAKIKVQKTLKKSKSAKESKSLNIKHSGGTDSYGCHIESATGIRHCH